MQALATRATCMLPGICNRRTVAFAVADGVVLAGCTHHETRRYDGLGYQALRFDLMLDACFCAPVYGEP
jgi:hypothetical protein